VSSEFYRVFYRTDRQGMARVGPVGHRTAQQALGSVVVEAGAASWSSLPCRGCETVRQTRWSDPVGAENPVRPAQATIR